MTEMFNKLLKDKEDMDIIEDYEIIHRIISNINELNLINSLNLKKNDPENFLSILEKYKSLERRKRTLSKQFFLYNTSLNSSDTEELGKNLIGISTYFLEEKKHHRLYLSHTFEQMAKLKNDTTVCSLLRRSFRGNKKYMPPGKIKVFNMFIESSDKYFENENYSNALIMLDNAINWCYISEMQLPEATIKSHMEKVVDGILNSYLQIAYSSLKIKNTEMTQEYLTKVKSGLYKFNNNYPFINDSLLSKTKKALTDIIEYYADIKEYNNALKVFESFQDLKLNHTSNKSIISNVFSGIYNNYLNKINTNIINNNYDLAYENIIAMRKFLTENLRYLKLTKEQVQKTKNLASSLYNYFSTKSGITQNNRSSSSDSIYFNKANTLKNKFNI